MKLARHLAPAAVPSSPARPHRSTAPSAAPSSPSRPRPGAIGIDSFVLPRKGASPAPRVTGGDPQDLGDLRGRTSGYTMTYRGGKVLDAPVLQPIYLGKYWTTPAGKADRGALDGFAGEVVKGRHQAVLAQYGVGAGTSQASVVAAGDKAVPRISRDAIAALVLDQIRTGAVKDGPQTVHTVFLPPNAVLETGDGTTSLDGLGGFHGSVIDANGKPVYFAAIAYSKGKNGIDFDGKARDNITITASHEWDEACTDPDVENGQLGWYNDRYGEVGDLAVNSGLVPLAQAFVKDEAGYAVQVEWSNQDKAFVGVKDAAPPSPKPGRPTR